MKNETGQLSLGPSDRGPLTPVKGALQVASYSIRVFPVWAATGGFCACPDGNKCSSPGKHPIQRSWQQNATTNKGQILAWNKRYGDCNWGMRTDDLPTADIDPRAGGTLEAIQTKLPATAWKVSTGGGGWHLGYLPPTNSPVPKGGNNLFGPGLDVKAKGGFVVCVGSVHVSGVSYTWATEDGGPPDQDAIPPWPPAAPPVNGSDPGDTTPGPGPRSTLAALLASPPASEGEGRNDWLSKIAGHVFRHFPYDDGAIQLVRTLNNSLDQPLDETEIAKVIGSIGGTDNDARDARFQDAVAIRAWTMRVSQEAAREIKKEAWREPPPTESGDDWLAQIYEEDPWSIVDLLPAGGNALLAAQYKVGKTHLLLNLMQSLCDGKPFLGRFSTGLVEGARVGYFNYELPPAMIQRWVRALDIQNPDRFVMANLRGFNVRMGTSEGDEWAIEHLKRWDIDAWIIDPYAMAFSGESENDNTEVTRFTASLDRIKEQAGVSIAILGAHFGRQEFETGAEHVRGATRLDDWADARWIMTKNQEDERFFSASGRDVQVEESRLSFASTTKRLTLMEGARFDRGQERVVGEVLRYVARVAKSKTGDELKLAITGKAIEDQVSGRHSLVRAVCKDLVEKGTLVLVIGEHGERWHYPHDHPEIGQTDLHVVE